MEEYCPQIVYIKGVDTIVADAIIQLDYEEKSNTCTITVPSVWHEFG